MKSYDGCLWLYDDLYGAYRQVKFTDVWNNDASFLEDYKSSRLECLISDKACVNLYYLLYSRYGNNVIASSDLNRFKYDVWGIIFSYGPSWEKRLEIQKQLRDLSDADLMTGYTQIQNHANNPGTAPSTSTLDELLAINDQVTSKGKRDKMSAYAMLMELLKTDVTQQFLDKFKKLFITVLQPDMPLLYGTPDDEEDE